MTATSVRIHFAHELSFFAIGPRQVLLLFGEEGLRAARENIPDLILLEACFSYCRSLVDDVERF